MFTNKLKAARELSFDGQTAAKSSAPFKAQLHFISRCMQQVTYTVVYSLHALTLPLFIILYDTADSVVALHQKETIPSHHDAATIDICHYPAASYRPGELRPEHVLYTSTVRRAQSDSAGWGSNIY